jgi:K+-sensing histidine kinase KdpD
MSEGVVVSVTDHGTGIRRDVIAKAFSEPFTAGEDILRKERAGAGVGLHMARQIVLQHGGIMWADPLPAGGTRVSFVIPAHAGDTLTRPPKLSEADASDPGAEPVPDDDDGTVVPFVHRSSNASSS